MNSATLESKQSGVKISFGSPKKGDFYSTVKERVDSYFKLHDISRHADRAMKIKTGVLLFFYVLSYSMIISNAYTGAPLIGLFSFLGLIMGLMGFNISHDMMHGSYFVNPKLNHIFSYFFDFNGTSSYVWKYTHNVQHHTYTNIPGFDEDIDKAILLRLSPADKLYSFHRYQWLYAPILYAFTSLNWVFYGDFLALYKRYKKGGVPNKELILFFSFKLIYLAVFLLLPLYVLSAPAWQVLLGFCCLHFTGGFMIAVIFQLAHVVEGVDFPAAESVHEPWATHEMKTTSNFGIQQKLNAILFGGLNFQVEHHLFTPVCHTHYQAISPIVKKTAEEFGLPYHELPSLKAAVTSHFKKLYKLGLAEPEV